MSHTMTVRADWRNEHKDCAELWMTCPDCPDLTMRVTIGPASTADHFIATVRTAHERQMTPWQYDREDPETGAPIPPHVKGYPLGHHRLVLPDSLVDPS